LIGETGMKSAATSSMRIHSKLPRSHSTWRCASGSAHTTELDCDQS
jgi:hypothetical protein